MLTLGQAARQRRTFKTSLRELWLHLAAEPSDGDTLKARDTAKPTTAERLAEERRLVRLWNPTAQP